MLVPHVRPIWISSEVNAPPFPRQCHPEQSEGSAFLAQGLTAAGYPAHRMTAITIFHNESCWTLGHPAIILLEIPLKKETLFLRTA
jgi:hypothetical protein